MDKRLQQVGINLAALGTFAMTVSVLMGPLVGIPPAVPAVTVLGFLTVFAADTLAWNGRLTLLGLDTFAGQAYRDRVLRHEAGHFLVAHILKIPIEDYTLTAWEALRRGYPGAGGTVFDVSPLAEAEKGVAMERLSAVWMAGVAAETLVYGNAEGGSDDRASLKEALQVFGYSGAQATQKERLGQLKAKTLLEEHQEAYDALVKAMGDRASVADCLAAIGAHYL
ncbi:MAG: ATP-dependent Zn protease [Cyanobacteria bacterium J06641_5]